MNKSNDDLIVLIVIIIAASGILCSYFLRPDYYPSNLDFIGSLVAGIKNYNSWISIALYALLTTVISLFCSALLLFGVLKSEDAKSLAYFFIFFMILVTAAVIKFSTPEAPLKNLSGIWKDENNDSGGVLMIDLSSSEPILGYSVINENEFSYPYTKIEHVNKDNKSVTVSISVEKNSNNKMIMTLSESNSDGRKKILVTGSSKPTTLTFIRPVLGIDYARTIKASEANSRNAILINNCKVEIHNKNKRIVFYDETPTPLLNKIVKPIVYKGNDGYAVSVYSGLPPTQNNVFEDSEVIKCTFSEDFKNITLTTCDELISQCD